MTGCSSQHHQWPLSGFEPTTSCSQSERSTTSHITLLLVKLLYY